MVLGCMPFMKTSRLLKFQKLDTLYAKLHVTFMLMLILLISFFISG